MFPTSYFLKELSSAGVTLEGRVSSAVEAAPVFQTLFLAMQTLLIKVNALVNVELEVY